VTQYQYVVDPTAKRLIERGAPRTKIEDAYTLSLRRGAAREFQAWVQQYVDHGISLNDQPAPTPTVAVAVSP
jgi:hypothetical protein